MGYLVVMIVAVVVGYAGGTLAKPEYVWLVRAIFAGWVGFCGGLFLYIGRRAENVVKGTSRWALWR